MKLSVSEIKNSKGNYSHVVRNNKNNVIFNKCLNKQYSLRELVRKFKIKA